MNSVFSIGHKLNLAFSRNEPFAFGYQKVLNFLPPCSCGGIPQFVGFTEWPLGEGFERGKILRCSKYGVASWDAKREKIECCQMEVRDTDAANVLYRWVVRLNYESDAETTRREMKKYSELFSHLEPDRVFPYGFDFYKDSLFLGVNR